METTYLLPPPPNGLHASGTENDYDKYKVAHIHRYNMRVYMLYIHI